MKLQVLTSLLSSAQGVQIFDDLGSRSLQKVNAYNSHLFIFKNAGPNLFTIDFYNDVIKVKVDQGQISKKWTINKYKQLEKLGEKTMQAFERCGAESE